MEDHHLQRQEGLEPNGGSDASSSSGPMEVDDQYYYGGPPPGAGLGVIAAQMATSMLQQHALQIQAAQ